MVFSRRFFWVLKINFVTKSYKVEIFKKHHISHFLVGNNIKREKYFKGSMFLKVFDISYNKLNRWRQKFTVGVTKLMPPDEIRSFDGKTLVALVPSNLLISSQGQNFVTPAANFWNHLLCLFEKISKNSKTYSPLNIFLFWSCFMQKYDLYGVF